MKIKLKNVSLFERHISQSDLVHEHFLPGKMTDKEVFRDIEKKPTNLIDILNSNYKVIFSDVDKDILLLLVGFSMWSNFVSGVNKLLPFTSREAETAYNVHDETIRVFGDTLNRDISIIYDFMLSKGCSPSLASSTILLHEIGHAVHHQTEKLNGEYLDLSTPEANFINKFTMFFQGGENHNSMYETDTIIRNATREGYADLYSCILMDKLYSKKEATVAIMALKAYRDKYNKKEKYYTADSISRYIGLREYDDLNDSINNFTQLNKLISAVVSETAMKILSQNSVDTNHSTLVNKSRFLGFIDGIYEFGNDDINSAMMNMKDDLPVLKEFIENINHIIRYDYNPKEFDIGKQNSVFWKENYLPLKPTSTNLRSSKHRY